MEDVQSPGMLLLAPRGTLLGLFFFSVVWFFSYFCGGKTTDDAAMLFCSIIAATPAVDWANLLLLPELLGHSVASVFEATSAHPDPSSRVSRG